MAKRSARHGQNFLVDLRYAARIVDTLPDGVNFVLEVGPGHGILTELILQKGIKAAQIWAVELDSNLADGLRQKWPTLQVTTADILKVDPKLLGLSGPFYLLSNLAYDISKPFFDRLIDWHGWLTGATIMVQKEFAAKITRQEKSSAQGIMLAQLFAIERRFQVPPGAFRPPPKVDSTVLTLAPRHQEMAGQEIQDYYRFLKLCFCAPRKTVQSNLRLTFPQIATALAACAIPATSRAEELGPPDFAALWQAIRPFHRESSQT